MPIRHMQVLAGLRLAHPLWTAPDPADLDDAQRRQWTAITAATVDALEALLTGPDGSADILRALPYTRHLGHLVRAATGTEHPEILRHLHHVADAFALLPPDTACANRTPHGRDTLEQSVELAMRGLWPRDSVESWYTLNEGRCPRCQRYALCTRTPAHSSTDDTPRGICRQCAFDEAGRLVRGQPLPTPAQWPVQILHRVSPQPPANPATQPAETVPAMDRQPPADPWRDWAHLTSLRVDWPDADAVRALLDATWLYDPAAPALTAPAKDRVLLASAHLVNLRPDLDPVLAAGIVRALTPLIPGPPGSPDMTPLRLGRALHDHRVAAGVPTEEAADALGWTTDQLRALEVGHWPITSSDLDRLMIVFRVNDHHAMHALRALVRDTPDTRTPAHHAQLIDTLLLGAYGSYACALEAVFMAADLPVSDLATVVNLSDLRTSHRTTRDLPVQALIDATTADARTALHILLELPGHSFAYAVASRAFPNGPDAVLIYRDR